MSKNDWYVMLDNSEQGPLNPRDIKQLVDQGQILPDTLIRRGDMASMVPAAKVKGLFAAPAVPAQQQSNEQIADQQHDHFEQDVEAENSPQSLAEPKKVTTSRHRRSAQQANVSDDDDFEPNNTPCSFGSRVASHIIDNVFMGIIFTPLIMINIILIIGMFVEGTKSSIDEKRQRLSSNFPIPSYDEYTKSGEYIRGLPPEPPNAAPPGPEDESEADKVARYNAHVQLKNTYAEKKYLRELYERDTEEIGAALDKGFGVAFIVYIVLFILLTLYPVIFESFFGGTIGKLICKQVVVYRKNGRRISFGTALLRHLLRIIPLGQLRALANDRLTLHDLWSGTMVIPKSQYAPENKFTNRIARSTTSRVSKTKTGRVRRK